MCWITCKFKRCALSSTTTVWIAFETLQVAQRSTIVLNCKPFVSPVPKAVRGTFQWQSDYSKQLAVSDFTIRRLIPSPFWRSLAFKRAVDNLKLFWNKDRISFERIRFQPSGIPQSFFNLISNDLLRSQSQSLLWMSFNFWNYFFHKTNWNAPSPVQSTAKRFATL